MCDARQCPDDWALSDALQTGGAGVDRRAFLRIAATGFCALAAQHLLVGDAQVLAAESIDPASRREASFYEKLPDKMVQCKLCPRECVVEPGDRGFCRVRENRKGVYYTLVYSRVVAAHIDPIEKKPFFHFLPGAQAYSIASGGCNVHCKFCQNWEIAQARPEDLKSALLSPSDLSSTARENRCRVIAYTYSEPIVFWEYVFDAAEAGHRQGVRSVMVSNGFIQQEPLIRLCKRLDALKVDLKSFSETYYRDVVRGELKPVLNTLVTARKHAPWLEIVYLVVPTLNDGEAELRSMARWIKNELGPDVPIHFSRFYPLYLLKNLPPTPVKTLERAKAIMEAEGLHYSYVGNVPGHPGQHTLCPRCRTLLIERTGYVVKKMDVKNGKCIKCGLAIPGIWSA